MDVVIWIIFLWLFFNMVLGGILLLVTWCSGKFDKFKPGQLSSNDAKQSSQVSPSLGEMNQVEMREIGKERKPSKAV